MLVAFYKLLPELYGNTVEPQSYRPLSYELFIKRTLKLNKYLVSIIKIAIKRVKGYKFLLIISVLAN